MPSNNDLEHRLLCACSIADNRLAIQRLLNEAAEPIDWEAVVNAAYGHGITGLLCHNLLHVAPELVPREILHAGTVHLRQLADRNRAGAAQLLQVLDALAAAGIRAIPFKGPMLADSAYGDLQLRSFRDLDFLVPVANADAAIAVLNGLGFRRTTTLRPRQWREFVRYAGQDILHGPRLPVEPHWAFAPRTMAYDFDYAGLFARASQRSFEGHPVWRFSPEDELIILCVHGAKEQWPKLKWVADVAAFAGRQATLDWEAVVHRASDQGFARIVRMALWIAERLCGLALTERMRVWIKSDPRGAAVAEAIAEDFFGARPPQTTVYQLSRFHWASRERWRDKVRYVWRTITQPRVQHFQCLRMPDALFALYWPFKLAHDYIALPVWLMVKRPRAHGSKVVADESS